MIRDYAWSILDEKWDYYYLRKQLKISKRGNSKTLVAGSSYGIFGIEPLKECVNLSLPSQDIYYANKLVMQALVDNKNIKKVFLCFGYYSCFCDLSKSSENFRIEKVYYPLLKDSHNIKWEKKRNAKIYKSKNILKSIINKFIGLIIHVHYMSNVAYFDDKIHTREKKRLRMWKNEKKWNELSELERIKVGAKRAHMHEKQMKYTQSSKENFQIMEQLYELCKKKSIELNFLIFPFTEEYLEGMSQQYNITAQTIKKEIGKYCDFIYDFNEKLNFNKEDFVDADHLNDKGAIKFTNMLVKMIDL